MFFVLTDWTTKRDRSMKEAETSATRMLPAMEPGVRGRNATAMPSKDCHARQRRIAQMWHLQWNVLVSWQPQAWICLPPRDQEVLKRGQQQNPSWMVGRKATDQRAGNISDDKKQPYSIPTVFIMHICTSNVYWITLKLFNKTINVEFCVYFVIDEESTTGSE